MSLGKPPNPVAPWRIYIFRVHCIVTQRWMKIRLSFAWFWYGEDEYGTPEVESGTIAAANPTPPALGSRLPVGTPALQPVTHDEVARMREDLMRQAQAGQPPTLEERMIDMEERLRQAESAADQALRGPDTNRGGR